MTLTELKKEAYLQVLRLAARHGYADMDIRVTFHKPGVSRKLHYRTVMRYFCEMYGLQYETVFSNTRKEHILEVRQMIQYCIRQLCCLSYAETGKLTGGWHYATVMNSCKRIKNLMQTDKEFNNDMLKHIDNLLK